MFPSEFVNNITAELGAQRAEKVLKGLESEPLVSVRVNPFKMTLSALREHFGDIAGDSVQWAADEAFYLTERPSFTLDPLFHAGGYYVQEASSMYVGKLFDRAVEESAATGGMKVLDLCAAPGGKTTQLLSHLPAGSHLVANEVIGSRVAILAENVAKWGCGNVTVTNSDPSAFSKASDRKGGMLFDIVVVDAPCSGEGMFRKGDQAAENWSQSNVALCAARQRRIVSDVWDALACEGYMIYSTCTFNHYEDEDNVNWICDTLEAELLEMRHFYPGEDRGEGFFAALLKKKSGNAGRSKGFALNEKDVRIFKSIFPDADLALSIGLDRSKYTVVPLCKEDALKFLAKEPLLFPDAPVGLILLTYKNLALGFVKNLGRRSNNLHPMPRRIRHL